MKKITRVRVIEEREGNKITAIIILLNTADGLETRYFKTNNLSHKEARAFEKIISSQYISKVSKVA